MNPLGLHQRRGSALFGLIAMIAFVMTLCGAVMFRSADTYRAASRADFDLRALAAAEGVALLLEARDPKPDFKYTISATHVSILSISEDGVSREVVLQCDVHVQPTDPVLTREFQARYEGDGESWALREVHRLK